MIAVSRCLIVTGKSKILSSPKVQIFICILIRIYGILLLIPTNLKAITYYLVLLISMRLCSIIYLLLFQKFGEFGFNCQWGNCNFIPNEFNYSNISPDTLLDSIAFIIPCIIIIVSYGYIWYCMKHLSIDQQFQVNYSSQKEARITWTLFLVCFCFMLFELPLTIYKTIYDLGLVEGNAYISMALYFLYWFQYSLNFFIYAVRSDQFRKAYFFFLKEVVLNYTYVNNVFCIGTYIKIFFCDY